MTTRDELAKGPEYGDYVRIEGQTLFVRQTSDGKPYVILGSHEHVIREGDAVTYDLEAMTCEAERLAAEAGRLVAKCRRIVGP